MSDYHYVAWSGGLDSTYILDTLAKEHSTPSSPIYTITMIHPDICTLKQEAEKKARERYLKYARKKGYNIQDMYLEIAKSPPVYMGSWFDDNATRGIQQTMWLFSIMPYIWENSTIHFGHLRGEEFYTYRTYIDNIFENLLKIRNMKNVKICYDLEYKEKWKILDKISSDLYWYCENPKKKNRKIIPCESCKSCITHKVAWYKKSLKEISK